ncbi:RNA 2',3'-cyclic phosphodiesterase [uncultured Draconibacterium sp.]|uniref:RNA 2',3'-cyclic phosphodiesterase n=1 Tax=uncultured Draconibacterium sp. TaxID=1573823 RepID=UPI003217BA2A
MQSQIRTFVAIKIHPDEKLLRQIRTFKHVFDGERINWVPEDQFHLTLRFIGNTTREQLYELVDRFEILMDEYKSFELQITGAGYFNSKGQPRVLFVKIADSVALQKLAASIESNVTAVGFQQELKAFRPHLTLGRIKHLKNKNRFILHLDDLEETEYQKVNVTSFILYQSILRAEGPIYKTIKIFELK